MDSAGRHEKKPAGQPVMEAASHRRVLATSSWFRQSPDARQKWRLLSTHSVSFQTLIAPRNGQMGLRLELLRTSDFLDDISYKLFSDGHTVGLLAERMVMDAGRGADARWRPFTAIDICADFSETAESVEHEHRSIKTEKERVGVLAGSSSSTKSSSPTRSSGSGPREQSLSPNRASAAACAELTLNGDSNLCATASSFPRRQCRPFANLLSTSSPYRVKADIEPPVDYNNHYYM
jgi:hypothetical protein